MAYVPVSKRGTTPQPGATPATVSPSTSGYIPVAQRKALPPAALKDKLLDITTKATPALARLAQTEPKAPNSLLAPQTKATPTLSRMEALPPLPKPSKPVGDTISQGPQKTLAERFRDTEIGQTLFGRGQEVDIAGNLKEDRGALGFFGSSFNRSNFTKVDEVLQDLKKAGVDDKRANEIALTYADTSAAVTGSSKGDAARAGLNLTPEEKSVLFKRRIINAANLAFDLPSGAGLAVGSIKKTGEKTLEEFLASHIPVWRGGKALDKSAVTDLGISVSPDKQIADSFVSVRNAPGTAKTQKLFISPDAKIGNIRDVPEDVKVGLSIGPAGERRVAQWGRENGYDAIDLGKEVGIPEIRVLNADVLKTKEELSDIYKSATRSSEIDSALPSPTEDIPKKTPLPTKSRLPEGKGSGRALTEEQSLEALARQVDGMPRSKIAEDIFTTPKAAKDTQALRDKGEFSATKQVVGEDQLALELEGEGLNMNRAKKLAKWARKTGEEAGTLPEVTGTGKSIFARKGDDIASELGFKDSEEAREEYVKYVAQRERFDQTRAAVREKVLNYRDRKAVLEALRKEVNIEARSRTQKIRAVQGFFKLSDEDLSAVMKQTKFGNVKLLSDKEFDQFMNALEAKSTENYELGGLRLQLRATIYNRELKKTENLREVFKFPKIENMNAGQLTKFNRILNTFKNGDEFLTVRQLETIKNTDIKNIKTVREAREALARDAGIPVSQLRPEFRPGTLDRFHYDTVLATKHPLYDVMVTERYRAFLQSQANYVGMKKRMDELIGAARKSRKRGLLDRFIPTDKNIFNWLEADAVGKYELSKTMTSEEIRAAKYIRNLYSRARDYLVQMNVLKRYRSDYITHIRRGFLEAWREDGLMPSFREMFDQYKNDEAMFNILNSKTGAILPLEKFFQFSMKRSGTLTPTKNVSRAVLAYMSSFEKKRALDSLVPKIEIYAHSLTPRTLTPRGLEFDSSLKTFVKEWLNTKKGRPVDTKYITPGGKIDWALRSGVAFTRLLDLGFSIPTGLSANVGEQILTAGTLGVRGYARGIRRMNTRQGRTIVRKYENFVGESVFDKLKDTTGGLGDKLSIGLFGLFSIATRQANKIYLLSEMSKDEFRTGTIGIHRLAQMQKELGKYRVVDGSKSILGSTAGGAVAGQYRSWAIPILETSLRNLNKVRKEIASGNFKKAVTQPETRELFRLGITTAIVGGSLYGYSSAIRNKKPADRTFLDELALKAARDSLTLIGALDPSVYTNAPRLSQFLYDVSKAIDQIVRLEKYKTGKNKGTLKGDNALINTVTPSVVRQAAKAVTQSNEKPRSSTPGLPKLPPLPKMPKGPQLPKLPTLPKLPQR